jgi:cytochrome P450
MTATDRPATATAGDRLWDPLDPAFRADPYPFYDRLRSEAPSTGALRTEGADGEPIVVEPGQTLLTVLGAANHDPAVFDDPHALRLDRDNAGRHTAFSAGIHYCLGASLAKLEAGIASTRLIRRFETIELAGEPHWRDRLTIRGVDRLPLSLA